MTYIFIDAAIVAVILFCIWSGYRKGFVLTLCGFLAVFVALIGASIAADLLAEPLAALLQSPIQRSLQHLVDSVPSVSPADPQNASAGMALPLDSLLHYLEHSDSWYSKLADGFRESIDPATVTDALAAFAHYIASLLAPVIIFVLAFVAVSIAWFLLSHALDLAFKLPVLSTLNAWSGAAVGFVKGMILIYIAVWVLRDSFITRDVLEGSFLLPFFAAGPAALFSMISQ